MTQIVFFLVLLIQLAQLSFGENFCTTVSFAESTLRSINGGTFEISNISVAKYGPDRRLYLGSTFSEIFALELNKNLEVQQKCSKNIAGDGPRRWVLGIAFDHRATDVKMFFTTSTLFWMRDNFIMDFGEGWTNGKVQTVTVSASGCFNTDVTDVITGLPVSNGDHSTNWIQFLPNGNLLIGVGGFTNGGITDSDDLLGGIPPTALSGSILQCPSSGTNIMYSNLLEPSLAIPSSECSVYAPGFRNSFNAVLHTNGQLYATDNGPNASFGDFSTDCDGGRASGETFPDKLHRVQRGKCHGHPNLVRGAQDSSQCVREDPSCVSALISNLQPSMNGLVEYRSNLFSGTLKGNIFTSQFSGGIGSSGRVSRVVLNGRGSAVKSFVDIFHPDSGLSIVEGPRGELIMSRVAKNSFLVLTPICNSTPEKTYLTSVHPRRGPASGGHRVTISGYNFGASPKAVFGLYPCNDVVSLDNDSFSCVTPAGRPNSQVTVTATGSTGNSQATEGSDYWYW